MKTILSVMILSLLSLSALAAPKRAPNMVDLDSDQRFVCKNESVDHMYVVNVTDGTIDIYENDHALANGNPRKLGEMNDLVVKKDVESIEGTRKQTVSYTLSKKIKTSTREILRPVAEIEMDTGSDSKVVVTAEMKEMDFKASEVAVNLNCKGSKKN